MRAASQRSQGDFAWTIFPIRVCKILTICFNIRIFELVKFDVNQPINLDDFPELDKFKIKFQGIQEIYHLACPTSPKDFENLKMRILLSNSASLITTLDLALRYHAKYVFSSSSVVMVRRHRRSIFSESDEGMVDHLNQRACYDEGKIRRNLRETYRQVHGLDAKIAQFLRRTASDALAPRTSGH